jgi:hypothetical protein
MTFDRAGRFTTSGGAGSISSTDNGGSVSSNSRRAPGRGTYSIEGFVLTLRHDDGRVEHRSIVTHPKDRCVVWIDGAPYTGGD